MNALEPRLRTLVAWLLPLALLTGVIGWETNWGRASPRLAVSDVAPSPQPLSVALLPEYVPDNAAAGTREMVSRTLFNPTRRPAPVAVVETAKPKMQRGQFALTGTTVVEGKATAFLRETKGGKPRRVVQGETIDGLLVADVKADRVRLTMGEEAEELLLKVTTNSRPTPQPPLPQMAAGGAVPGTPAAQAVTPAAPEVSRILAERRRAAREAQANEGAPAPDGRNRVPLVAPNAPAAPAAAAPGAIPPPATPPDARWQQIYQQYQQRSR
ncbi:MAG: hypothetical protein H0T80_05675 [Betaproteobacteria bacterium]|nr:hypothetical protein [Betaproteobacteria bacterium]MBA3776201.1 hypothetical protein [Betaproteobacteria bacterium]